MKRTTLFVALLAIVGSMFALTCYDIQYTEDSSGTSPYFGQTVTVEGIVAATEWKGYVDFFIVDPEGGPWHGLYIYDDTEEYGDMVSVGDMISLTGLVDEYYDMTELKELDNLEIISSGNDVPPAYRVSCGDLASNEANEGCHVYVTGELTVTQAPNDGNHYEWYVSDGEDECQIDDGFFYLNEVNPPIVIEVDQVWGTIRGFVDFSYENYAINPVTPEDISENEGADDETVPAMGITLGNYPNPFNPETTIEFSIPEAGNTTLDIYNVRGQKITTLINDRLDADTHQVVWNGTDANGKNVTSGIYFYKLISGRYTSTKKMILLK